MSQPHDTEALSNTIMVDSHSDLSPPVAHPSKMQKLKINPQTNACFFQETPLHDGSGPSGHPQQQYQDEQFPAQDSEYQHTEHNQETEPTDPFFYYQESHAEENIQSCNHNLIGKILFDKPISTQILHSSLNGIWCNLM